MAKKASKTKAKKSAASPQKTTRKTKNTKLCKSVIIVKYDVGFPNQVTIRGDGPGLIWEKGQPMKNLSADTWIWETTECFDECVFKVLINDHIYEGGDNHLLVYGQEFTYTPYFS